MIIFNSSDGPYMVLWYLFLVFLGLVLIMNVLALLAKEIIEWRIHRLTKKTKKARHTDELRKAKA